MTDKQEAFVTAYLANGYNATQAVITAGYSPVRASEQGYQLLQIPTVKEAIEKGKQAQLSRISASHERVLQEMERQYQRAVEQDNVPAATRLLELIGKHLGMYVDRVEQDTTVNIRVQRVPRVLEVTDSPVAGMIEDMSDNAAE